MIKLTILLIILISFIKARPIFNGQHYEIYSNLKPISSETFTRLWFRKIYIVKRHWTYSVTFATDIERGNVTFKDLSNRESGSRFPMKNCSLGSRFFFFFNNCSTIFHWETAPRFAVRKIFERDIATFNVAGKSNWVGLLITIPIYTPSALQKMK